MRWSATGTGRACRPPLDKTSATANPTPSSTSSSPARECPDRIRRSRYRNGDGSLSTYRTSCVPGRHAVHGSRAQRAPQAAWPGACTAVLSTCSPLDQAESAEGRRLGLRLRRAMSSFQQSRSRGRAAIGRILGGLHFAIAAPAGVPVLHYRRPARSTRLRLARRLYEKFTDYARRQGRREFACHHRSRQHRLDPVSSVSRLTVSQPVAESVNSAAQSWIGVRLRPPAYRRSGASKRAWVAGAGGDPR
jgi:hypothetical protein